MSPLREIWFVALRELRKSFRSAKGVVLLVLTLLGGTGAALLLVKLQQLKRERLAGANTEMLRELREEAATQVFGDPQTGKALADAPEVLLMVLLLTIWLTPMAITLLGFDSVSSDLQHRSVRYWTLRSRRSSFYIGKWVGLWATISTMTLAMHALVWILCVARGEAPAAAALGWGVRFWLVTLPISAAWCALATFLSSLFRAPMLALLVTLASFFALWLLWGIGQVQGVKALQYAYPNFYDAMLVSPKLESLATGVAACIGMVVLYVGGGVAIFARRDV